MERTVSSIFEVKQGMVTKNEADYLVWSSELSKEMDDVCAFASYCDIKFRMSKDYDYMNTPFYTESSGVFVRGQACATYHMMPYRCSCCSSPMYSDTRSLSDESLACQKCLDAGRMPLSEPNAGEIAKDFLSKSREYVEKVLLSVYNNIVEANKPVSPPRDYYQYKKER